MTWRCVCGGPDPAVFGPCPCSGPAEQDMWPTNATYAELTAEAEADRLALDRIAAAAVQVTVDDTAARERLAALTEALGDGARVVLDAVEAEERRAEARARCRWLMYGAMVMPPLPPMVHRPVLLAWPHRIG